MFLSLFSSFFSVSLSLSKGGHMSEVHPLPKNSVSERGEGFTELIPPGNGGCIVCYDPSYCGCYNVIDNVITPYDASRFSATS